jgi:hypothetical protein
MFAEFRLAQEMEAQKANGQEHYSRWLRAFLKFFGSIK